MKNNLEKIAKKIKKLSWFNNYHTFEELGIYGLRDNIEREHVVSSFNLSGKTVLDYGCNLGKATFMADKLGAKKTFGVDVMTDTIALSNEIAEAMGSKTSFSVVDLNCPSFDKKIEEFTKNTPIDVSFFFSIYGTKEFTNRNRVLRYILSTTKKLVFVEGHYMETWNKYSKLLLKYKSSAISFSFQGYLRDSVSTKDCVMRPFFVLKKGFSNWETICSSIEFSLNKQFKISIGFEGLAGTGKSYHAKKLIERLGEKYPNKTILLIDDLKASDDCSYMPIGRLRDKAFYFLRKYILGHDVKTLHAAYQMYDIVLISDYRLRLYINTIDFVVSFSAPDGKRREKISERGNSSHPDKYSTQQINSSNFSCKYYFDFENNYQGS